MPRHARLQRPKTLGTMASPTERRRAGWTISRLPKDKSSSALVGTATATGHENSPAARSRCHALSANASARPPDASSRPRDSIASPPRNSSSLSSRYRRDHRTATKHHRAPLICSHTVIGPRWATPGSPLAEISTVPRRQRPHTKCSKAPTLRALRSPRSDLSALAEASAIVDPPVVDHRDLRNGQLRQWNPHNRESRVARGTRNARRRKPEFEKSRQCSTSPT
jgi:hypothetical protein